MKKKLFVLTAICLSTAVLISCNASEKKSEQDSLSTRLKEDVARVKQDLVAQQEKFRKDAEEQIAENNRKIEELKIKIDKSTDKAKAEYQKQLEEIQAKNTALQQKLQQFKADSKESWDSFTREFSHDMDAIKKSLEALVHDDVK